MMRGVALASVRSVSEFSVLVGAGLWVSSGRAAHPNNIDAPIQANSQIKAA
jgi:hypothetical protein